MPIKSNECVTQMNGSFYWFPVFLTWIVCVCACVSFSVVSDSLRLHGLYLPGSSVHGILQARILEWVAIPFPRGSSQPRDRIQISLIAGRFFTIWATREARDIDYVILYVGVCGFFFFLIDPESPEAVHQPALVQ